MEAFEKAFKEYVAFAKIGEDKDLCALLSEVLEQYQPVEKQIELLVSAVKLNLDINQFVVRLGRKAGVSKISAYLKSKAENEDKPADSAMVLPVQIDPFKGIPRSKPAPPPTQDPTPGNAPTVFKPQAPGATSNSQPNVEEIPTDEDGGGDDGEEEKEDGNLTPKPQVPSSVPGNKPRPAAPVFKKQQPALEEYEPSDWFKHPWITLGKWNRNRQLKAEQKTGQSTGPSRMKIDVSGAKIALYVLLVAVVAGIIWIVANANPQGVTSAGVESQQVTEEAPPVDPNNIPLDVEGSVNKRGFVGELQKFVYALSLLTFLSVLGDRLYGRQFTDVIVYLIVTYSSIFLVLPPEVGVFTSVIVLLVLVGWITTASVQGEGKDFTIMVGWLLGTATIGGLVLTKIAIITNIFPKMSVDRVMAVVDLGYYFDTATLGLIAFSFVVYVFAFLALITAIFEAVRRSEEGTMPLAPLICALAGILFYFLPLHVLSLAPWLSASIGMLVSVSLAGMAISPTGRQFVPREWANKSPYDGAVLYLAIMTVLVIVFGHAGWLIGY